MKNILISLQPALHFLFKDKINFLLALIPILIGIALYIVLGSWIFGSVTDWGKELINEHISSGGWGTSVYYILSFIMTIAMFFIINWTFVLIVALIASPFNGIMSERIEKQMGGQTPANIGDSIKRTLSKLGPILFNELKKISFIISLTILGLILGLFPVVTPFSIAIAALLLTVEFVDYNWSRHELKFRDCLSDVKSNFISYLLSGAVFMFLITIPIVNLFMLPYGISYFTVLWCNSHQEAVS